MPEFPVFLRRSWEKRPEEGDKAHGLEDLADRLNKVSDSAVEGALADVEAYVSDCSREGLLTFFQSYCFQSLLYRLFGLEQGTGGGWLDKAAKGSLGVGPSRLLEFLKPTSPLISAAREADKLRLVTFCFPSDKLPAKAQRMLSDPSSHQTLASSLPYRGCVFVGSDPAGNKGTVQLSVYNFLTFWLAYFSARPCSTSEPDASPFAHLALAPTTAEHPLHGGGMGFQEKHAAAMRPSRQSKLARSRAALCQAVLARHLLHFLPAHSGSDVESSGAQATSTLPADVNQGTMLVSALAEFWLSDVGEDSLDIQEGSWAPPATERVASVRLLVQHVLAAYRQARETGDEGRLESIDPALAFLRRRLYTFLGRCMTRWPADGSEGLDGIVGVWTTYIAPWYCEFPKQSFNGRQHQAQRIVDFVAQRIGRKNEGHGAEESGSVAVEWRAFIDANAPFYCCLLTRFAHLCQRGVQSDPQGFASLLRKASSRLASNNAALMRAMAVERDMHDFYQRQVDALEGSSGSGHDLSRSSEAIPLLSAAISRIEWEGPREQERARRIRRYFSEALGQEMADTTGSALQAHSPSASEGASRRAPGADLRAEGQLPFEPPSKSARESYFGDWMERPISSSEVAPLARALVWASRRANAALRLDGESEPSLPLLCALRRRGLRVDLRFLAEAQSLALLSSLVALFAVIASLARLVLSK